MRKFIKLFLLSVSLCLFAFSCSLETAEDQSGSISLTLPGNQLNSRSTIQSETPTDYYIALFYGENATVNHKEGKVRDTHADSGGTVQFTKLRPGIYTLYVRGDAPLCYYEISQNIPVNPGKNDVSIKLGKKQSKAQVTIDLSSLSNVSYFDLVITDLNNNPVFSDHNIPYNQSFLVPVGFMTGKYNIAFETENSVNERYYIEGGNTFEVTRGLSGDLRDSNVNKKITSRPIRSFIVDPKNALDEGDGSAISPFKTLRYAIDKAIGSSDAVHEDINIIVNGNLSDENPILINNNVHLSLIGKSSRETQVDAIFLVDNASLSLKSINIDNPIMADIQPPTIELNNANLIMQDDALISSYCEVTFTGSSLITLEAPPVPDSSINLVLDSFEEGKKIAETTDPSIGLHRIKLQDNRYVLTENGTLQKVAEYVNISLDFDQSNKNLDVRYSSIDTADYLSRQSIDNGKAIIRYPFEIGKTYKFELLENILGSQEVKILSVRELTIQKNVENALTLSRNITHFYCDSVLGNDTLNNGFSSTSPFETIQRAINEIQSNTINFPDSAYVLDLTGDYVGGVKVDISNINNLTITSTDESYVNQELNVTSSTVTVKDFELDSVSLNDSTLNIDYTQSETGSESVIEVYNIKINDETSKIVPLKNLSQKTITVELLDSLYGVGLNIIDLSSIPTMDEKDSTIRSFSLKDPRYTVNMDGSVIRNSNVVVNLDIQPEQNRYAARIYENDIEKGSFPITGKNTEINYLFENQSSARIDILDLFNYNSPLATRNFTSNASGNSVDINLNRTVYISSNGSDTNDGLTKSQGFKTFNKALSTLVQMSNGDLDNQYQIVLCPVFNVGNRETKAQPMSVGDIVINDGIKLVIVGERPESLESWEEVLVPFNNDMSKSSITVNNPKADVYLSNILLNISDGTVSATDVNEGIINVKSGAVTIGNSFDILKASGALKTKNFANVGQEGKLTLTDATIGDFTSIYLDNHSKLFISPGFAESNLDKTEYNIILSDTYDTSKKVIYGDNLAPADYSYFNVNKDRYVDDKGMVATKIVPNVKIAEIPGNKDILTNRQYALKIKHGNYISSSIALDTPTPDTSSIKVIPNIPYDVQVLDNEIKDDNGNPIPIIISRSNVTFTSNSTPTITLFDILVPGETEYGSCDTNAIKNTLKDIGTSLRGGTNPITKGDLPVTIQLDGDYYREYNWVLGSGKDDINIPSNANITIKKLDTASVAKVYAEQTSREILIRTDIHSNIRFEDITFVSSGNNQKTLFNITQGNITFKNIVFENSSGQTFIKTPHIVYLDGTIDIPENCPINLVYTPSNPTEPSSTESVGGVYVYDTLSDPTPETKIVLDVINSSDGTQAFKQGLQVIPNYGGGYVKPTKDNRALFTLKSPGGDGFTINENGATEVKTAP